MIFVVVVFIYLFIYFFNLFSLHKTALQLAMSIKQIVFVRRSCDQWSFVLNLHYLLVLVEFPQLSLRANTQLKVYGQPNLHFILNALVTLFEGAEIGVRLCSMHWMRLQNSATLKWASPLGNCSMTLRWAMTCHPGWVAPGVLQDKSISSFFWR